MRTDHHRMLVDWFATRPAPSWGERALLACLERVDDPDPTRIYLLTVHDAWAFDDGFCIVYGRTGSPSIGMRAVRGPEDEELGANDFGRRIATEEIVGRDGNAPDDASRRRSDVSWWGTPPYPEPGFTAVLREPHFINMFPDFSAPTVLWGGGRNGRGFGLSEELIARLDSWNDTWQQLTAELPEVPAEQAPAFFAEGRVLAARVAAELGSHHVICFSAEEPYQLFHVDAPGTAAAEEAWLLQVAESEQRANRLRAPGVRYHFGSYQPHGTGSEA